VRGEDWGGLVRDGVEKGWDGVLIDGYHDDMDGWLGADGRNLDLRGFKGDYLEIVIYLSEGLLKLQGEGSLCVRCLRGGGG